MFSPESAFTACSLLSSFSSSFSFSTTRICLAARTQRTRSDRPSKVARSDRILQPQCREGRAHYLFKWNGRRLAAERIDKSLHFRLVPLSCAQRARVTCLRPLRTSSIRRKSSRIATERLRKLRYAPSKPICRVGEIADCAQCAVREFQRGNEVIGAVLPCVAHRLRLHLDRHAARESREVNKMANFAENASASLLEIVHPMIGRNVAGIYR